MLKPKIGKRLRRVDGNKKVVEVVGYAIDGLIHIKDANGRSHLVSMNALDKFFEEFHDDNACPLSDTNVA